MNMRAVVSLVAAIAVVLVTATSAGAQSPANTVYNPNGEVLNVVSGGGGGGGTPTTGVGEGGDTTPVQRETGTTPTTATGSLPFTGFEAGLVAMAGIALLGAGFAMRRVSRSGA